MAPKKEAQGKTETVALGYQTGSREEESAGSKIPLPESYTEQNTFDQGSATPLWTNGPKFTLPLSIDHAQHQQISCRKMPTSKPLMLPGPMRTQKLTCRLAVTGTQTTGGNG